LAKADSNDLVKSVQEVYYDYYLANPDTFSLNILNAYSLTKSLIDWNNEDHALLQRIIDGLLGVIFSLRRIPTVRYLGSSDACRIAAEKLSRRIQQEYDDGN